MTKRYTKCPICLEKLTYSEGHVIFNATFDEDLQYTGTETDGDVVSTEVGCEGHCSAHEVFTALHAVACKAKDAEKKEQTMEEVTEAPQPKPMENCPLCGGELLIKSLTESCTYDISEDGTAQPTADATLVVTCPCGHTYADMLECRYEKLRYEKQARNAEAHPIALPEQFDAKLRDENGWTRDPYDQDEYVHFVWHCTTEGPRCHAIGKPPRIECSYYGKDGTIPAHVSMVLEGCTARGKVILRTDAISDPREAIKQAEMLNTLWCVAHEHDSKL